MLFRYIRQRFFLRPHKNHRSQYSARLGCERLETRDLLSIVWVNDGATNNADLFNDVYEVDKRDVARAIVRRAIADWNAVITDFNYGNDTNGNPSNTYHLSVFAQPLDNDRRGEVPFSGMAYNTARTPTAGTIRLDDNGGGFGWFFDATPTDDVEFTSIGNAFAATFVDVNGQTTRREDFYRTVAHEIGHALGLIHDFDHTTPAIYDMIKPLYLDSTHQIPFLDPTGIATTALPIYRFQSPNPQFGQIATFIFGSHLYEGDVYGVNNDPSVVYVEGSTQPLTLVTHPNDLYLTRIAAAHFERSGT